MIFRLTYSFTVSQFIVTHFMININSAFSNFFQCSSFLVNILNWNLRINERVYLSRDFNPVELGHETSWSSVRSSEEKMLQVWWETIALFIFPGETEAVIVSAERKLWKRKLNFKSRIYLSYVKIKRKKRNTHLSFGNVTLSWELNLLCLTYKNVNDELAESQICFAARLRLFGVELNLKNKSVKLCDNQNNIFTLILIIITKYGWLA